MAPRRALRHTAAMTVSRLRVAKSETRDWAERDRVGSNGLQLGDTAEWHMSNATFLKVFVTIAAGLTLAALVLR